MVKGICGKVDKSFDVEGDHCPYCGLRLVNPFWLFTITCNTRLPFNYTMDDFDCRNSLKNSMTKVLDAYLEFALTLVHIFEWHIHKARR